MQTDRYTLYCGDCLDILRDLPAGSVDAVITDPPYSSGGMYRADRATSTDNKYQISHETTRTYGTFSGDNRDQRSFEKWCSWWMAAALRTTVDGGVMGCFIDWRNLASVVDALQIGGWVYRGVTPWYKGPDQRPNKGWFRRNIEYLAWGSCGPLLTGPQSEGDCLDGMFFHRVNGAEKMHQTGKPIELLVDVVAVRPELRIVLDPFMGSGTTGVACMQTGRRFIGVEIDPGYFEIAKRRIEDAAAQLPLIPHEQEPQPRQEGLL